MEKLIESLSSVKLDDSRATSREYTTSYSLVQNDAELDFFLLSTKDKTSLAFDVEGNNLSRLGLPTLVSIGVCEGDEVKVFIFDLLRSNVKEIDVLKHILEDGNVEKIVHDCRQDSDALYTFHAITICGLFDTSVAQTVVSGDIKRLSLSDCLTRNGSSVRRREQKFSHDFYSRNPNYWGIRPVTEQMLQYAADDIYQLFELREKILLRASTEQAAAILEGSERAAFSFRGLTFQELVIVPKLKFGLVIGPRGSTLQSIETTSGAVVTCNGNFAEGGGFLVLASDSSKLARAKQLILSKIEPRISYKYSSDY
eukprot:gene2830-5558_t